MEKSREAFRTISEVAEWLDVPTHVLRFWESRFSQIKPVKRAGGRRYYRPSDMRVIGGVKTLLHDQGMTIRGVQKLFREQGIKHVSSFSPTIYGAEDEADDIPVIEADAREAPTPAPAPAARSTRDATPDPIVDPVEPEIPDAERADAAPMFSHARRDVAETHAPEQGADPDPVEQTPQEPEPQPAPDPTPAIPPTPDVPQSDAADDDPSHPGEPGVAARLVTARKAQLRGRGDTLSEAVQRLKDLRARLG